MSVAVKKTITVEDALSTIRVSTKGNEVVEATISVKVRGRGTNEITMSGKDCFVGMVSLYTLLGQVLDHLEEEDE